MTRKTKIRNSVAMFILILLALYGIAKAAPIVDTVIEYDAANEYQLKIGWDEPTETDIAIYVVQYREYGAAGFAENWYPIADIQTGADSTWSITGEFPLSVSSGDTTYYEFRVRAIDEVNNIGENSDPVYIGLYMLDTTPPAKVIGLFLRLVIVPKVN